MIDQLGDRFKQIEAEFNPVLDPSKITIIRLDGMRFHQFTKPFIYPYDPYLRFALEFSLLQLINKELQGYVSHVYFQSDEASIIIPPVEQPNQIPFSGRINKLISVCLQWNLQFWMELQNQIDYAFHTTNHFTIDNLPIMDFVKKIEIHSKKKTLESVHRYLESDYWYQLDAFLNEEHNYPAFDCRIFQIQEKKELYEYISWRRIDAIRNFKNSLGYCFYSPKELKGINADEIIKKIESDYPIKYQEIPMIVKRGAIYRYLKFKDWFQDGFDKNDRISNMIQKDIISNIQNWNEQFDMEEQDQ